MEALRRVVLTAIGVAASAAVLLLVGIGYLIGSAS